MKNLLPLLTAGLFLAACSKEDLEKPLEPISFSEYRKYYSEAGHLDSTRLAIHFHKVTEQALIKQYMAYPKAIAYCYKLTDTLITFIGKPCNDDCQINVLIGAPIKSN